MNNPIDEYPTTITANIPGGYHELPLTDIPTAIARSESIVQRQLGDAYDTFAEAAQVIANLLSDLREQNSCYCGIGQHAAPDGILVTSWLTLSILKYDSARNPRLRIADLVAERTTDRPDIYMEAVNIGGRTLLFSESTPTYRVGADKSDDDRPTATIHQIEAIIPSDDGSRIATAILSTADIAYGQNFRPMMMSLAASIQFRSTTAGTSSLTL
ncbi:hypothetical protein ACFWUP_06745 [Nocardia sp. NPDC058658]|uniref:hypothetical protein n=1 Tax=Nocardia sp. NPDC058658 TaxID=3346580 RepID=UPI003666395B